MYVCRAMQPLKARVHNGRLVLDEPTDLPEGEVVELVPLDDMLAGRNSDVIGEKPAQDSHRVETEEIAA